MTKRTAGPAGARRPHITIERTWQASIEEVWLLWTTKEGLESWWGPDGFTTVVTKLDVRPGGEQLYTMRATAPAQVAFMQQAGMPLATDQRVVYTDVVRHRRIAWVSRADFIPGVEPYDVAGAVEFFPTAQGVRMVLTLDAMHDAMWTERATMGWESQLGRFAQAMEAARDAAQGGAA